MDIKYSVTKGNLYIYLSGELDEFSARIGKDRLDGIIDGNINAQNVVFNLSKLTFMDSTGIGILLGRYRKLKKTGTPSFIQSPSVSVNKVLQISGLYKVMPKI
ncbi:MAG: anti-sigma factor antagonist [Clostridia bacterium]|nr:anti-sigma factor antagonist [Clostridia bacterium]MBR1676184.1 anti-sigma factor antagonist [Clostridia bacterium]